MTAPEQPVCGRGSCTPDCGMGHCYLADGPYQDPEHAHKASEQANEQAANEPPTAPKSPANDLRQRLTDAIRDATHVCIECDECGDGQCEDLPIIATTVGGDSDSGPIVIAAEGQPEAFADVCAAVVRPALDAKDAEIERITVQRDNARALFRLSCQERKQVDVQLDTTIKRAEAAEAELATQNAENDRLDQLLIDERTITARLGRELAQLQHNISAAHQHLNEIATERDAAIERAEAAEARLRDQSGDHT